jgi:hypothetical protein
MATRLSERLRRVSTGAVALVALLVFLLFTALVLPQQATKAEQETGSTDSPDTSFLYTPGDLYRMAASYGTEGRQAYVRARFTFDLVWPLVYTLFLVTGTSWVLGKAWAPDSRWQRANLTPLVAALFDYLENLSTSVVMLRYPAQTAVVDILAPLFTALKWGLLSAAFVLLVVGAVVAAWRRIRPRVQGVGRGEGDGGQG